MNTTDKDTRPTDEEIANAAYLLWEKNGCQNGRDAEYWFQAQSNLKGRAAKTASASSAPRTETNTGSASATATPKKTEEAQRKGKQNTASNRRQPAFA